MSLRRRALNTVFRPEDSTAQTHRLVAAGERIPAVEEDVGELRKPTRCSAIFKCGQPSKYWTLSSFPGSWDVLAQRAPQLERCLDRQQSHTWLLGNPARRRQVRSKEVHSVAERFDDVIAERVAGTTTDVKAPAGRSARTPPRSTSNVTGSPHARSADVQDKCPRPFRTYGPLRSAYSSHSLIPR